MIPIITPDQRDLIMATAWAMDQFRIIGGTLFNGAPPMHLLPGSTRLEGTLEDGSGRIVIRLDAAQPPFSGRPLVFEVWETGAQEATLDFAVTVPAHVLSNRDGGPDGGGGSRLVA
ncbi:MAG: hypothetical protein JJU24_05205 [Natronohydrobacter sp.]|nr:hypothetical protein [Natronohydrobacter sp.]